MQGGKSRTFGALAAAIMIVACGSFGLEEEQADPRGRAGVLMGEVVAFNTVSRRLVVEKDNGARETVETDRNTGFFAGPNQLPLFGLKQGMYIAVRVYRLELASSPELDRFYTDRIELRSPGGSEVFERGSVLPQGDIVRVQGEIIEKGEGRLRVRTPGGEEREISLPGVLDSKIGQHLSRCSVGESVTLWANRGAGGETYFVRFENPGDMRKIGRGQGGRSPEAYCHLM